MSRAVDPLLVVILLLNFLLLGTSRLRAVISGSAAQGTALGILLLAVHTETSWRTLLLAAVTVALKGVLIPGMLNRAMREASIRREVEIGRAHV